MGVNTQLHFWQWREDALARQPTIPGYLSLPTKSFFGVFLASKFQPCSGSGYARLSRLSTPLPFITLRQVSVFSFFFHSQVYNLLFSFLCTVKFIIGIKQKESLEF